jgi:hypothetical protein
MNQFRFIFVGAAGVVCATAFGQAQEIKFTSTNLGMGVAINYKGKNMNVFAGLLQFERTKDKVKFLSVCGDLDNMITYGQKYTVAPELSNTLGPNRDAAGRIVANAFNLVSNNDEATALQVAVWEAVYDATDNGAAVPDFTKGHFKAQLTNNVKAKAFAYYNTIEKGGIATYWNPKPDCAGQGQYTPVPEPATMIALAAGLAMAARKRRKS